MKLKPHIHRGRFYNHEHESLKTYLKSIIVSARHMVKRKTPFFPYGKEHTINEWTVTPQFNSTSQQPTITWLGHATFLIQINNYNIITDPVFGEISKFFPRMIPSPTTRAQLPPIDLVLVSHNHHDHLDIKSLKKLQQHTPFFFVPQGDKRWFDKHNIHHVTEYSWWEQHTLPARNGNEVTIQFLPAHHWSGRSIFSINKSLWGSWLITNQDQTIYFGGDTAMSNHFNIIGQTVKKIDIALLPIGPCEPTRGMKDSHINPEQALQAFHDLRAAHFIPMHWGTFRQGTDDFYYAVNLLKNLWETTNIPSHKKLHQVKFGEGKEIVTATAKET